MHKEAIEVLSIHCRVTMRFEAIYQDANGNLQFGQKSLYQRKYDIRETGRLTVIKGMAAPPPIAHRLETKTMDLSFRVANRYS